MPTDFSRLKHTGRTFDDFFITANVLPRHPDRCQINCNNKLEVENITETQQHLFLDKQYCRLISAHVNEYAQCEYLQASMYIMLQYIYIYFLINKCHSIICHTYIYKHIFIYIFLSLSM